MRTRVNFTPSGDLHIGSAHIARSNYQLARSLGYEFVLIVDDLCTLKTASIAAPGNRRWCDTVGMTPEEATSDITEYGRRWGERFLEDLHWLGIEPDLVVQSSSYMVGAREAIAEKLPMILETGDRGGDRREKEREKGWILPPSSKAYEHGEPLLEQTMPWLMLGNGFMYYPWLMAAWCYVDIQLEVAAHIRGSASVLDCALRDFFYKILAGHHVNQSYTFNVTRESGPSHKSVGALSMRALRQSGWQAVDIWHELDELIIAWQKRLDGLPGISPVGYDIGLTIPAGRLEIKTSEADTGEQWSAYIKTHSTGTTGTKEQCLQWLNEMGIPDAEQVGCMERVSVEPDGDKEVIVTSQEYKDFVDGRGFENAGPCDHCMVKAQASCWRNCPQEKARKNCAVGSELSPCRCSYCTERAPLRANFCSTRFVPARENGVE